MSTTNTLPAQLSEKASVEQNGKKLYVLYYRQGSNPYPQFCFFWHGANDMSAMKRAQKHCEIQQYKFVRTHPAVIDMDRADNFLLNEG